MNKATDLQIAIGAAFLNDSGKTENIFFDDFQMNVNGDATFFYHDRDNKPQLYLGPIPPSYFRKLEEIFSVEIFDPIVTRICEKEYICSKTKECDVLAIMKKTEDGKFLKTILKWDLNNCSEKVHPSFIDCLVKSYSFLDEIREWFDANGIKPQKVTDSDLLNHINNLA